MKHKILTLEFEDKKVIITLDDESKKIIPLEAFLLEPLVQGEIIDDKRLKVIDERIEEQDAYKYSIKLLAKQSYSSYSLKEKLSKKYNENIINKVVTRLIDNNFINDKQFIISYFENRQSKAYATSRIILELNEMGFETIDEEMINTYKSNDLDCCLKYAKYYQKMHNKYDNKKMAEKLYQQLKTRGFDDEIINDCFKAINIGILIEY